MFQAELHKFLHTETKPTKQTKKKEYIYIPYLSDIYVQYSIIVTSLLRVENL